MFRLLAKSIAKQRSLSSFYLSIRSTATWEPRKSQGDGDGPNHALLTFLTDEMYMAAVEYPFRATASEICDAIKTIHALDYQLTIKHIPRVSNIPEIIVPKIITFLGGGSKSDFRASRRDNVFEAVELPADVAQRKTKARIMNLLQQVNGIGPIKARMLFERGCTSIEQLREAPFLSLLPKSTQATILFDEHATAPLTRREAEAFQNGLRNMLSKEFEVLLLGSYRREATSISDLEFVLFHSSYIKAPAFVSRTTAMGKQMPPEVCVQAPSSLLQETISALQSEGFVLASLSGSPSRWQGLVKIQHENKELVRKININLMPQNSKAAATLAFTGEPEYFHMCQKKAQEQYLLLNQYGLWRRPSNLPPLVLIRPHLDESFDVDISPPELAKVDEWELVSTPEEADILEELQLNSHAPLYKRNLCNICTIGTKQPPPINNGGGPVTWYTRDQPLWYIPQFLPAPLRARRMTSLTDSPSRQNERKRAATRKF